MAESYTAAILTSRSSAADDLRSVPCLGIIKVLQERSPNNNNTGRIGRKQFYV